MGLVGNTNDIVAGIQEVLSAHVELIAKVSHRALLAESVLDVVRLGVMVALRSNDKAYQGELADTIQETERQFAAVAKQIEAMTAEELFSGAVGKLVHKLYDGLPPLPLPPGARS